MKVSVLGLVSAFAIGMSSGCQSTTISTVKSKVDSLCDEYTAATKAGNIDKMQSLTQAIKSTMANENIDTQKKWLGDCLEDLNLVGR